MNKLDYYRAVLLGAVIGVCFVTVFHLVYFVADTKEPTKPQSNFEVVDTYKGCDVVRWTNHQLAEYKYFLHCEKK